MFISDYRAFAVVVRYVRVACLLFVHSLNYDRRAFIACCSVIRSAFKEKNRDEDKMGARCGANNDA